LATCEKQKLLVRIFTTKSAVSNLAKHYFFLVQKINFISSLKYIHVLYQDTPYGLLGKDFTKISIIYDVSNIGN